MPSLFLTPASFGGCVMAKRKSKPVTKRQPPTRKPRPKKPIDLYYWPTPNGWKITIMLEECGLPYNVVPVNIAAGEQFEPAFLKISPNNRMPAIIDHDAIGGPISIFESGAILMYLAEKTGQFWPLE